MNELNLVNADDLHIRSTV